MSVKNRKITSLACALLLWLPLSPLALAADASSDAYNAYNAYNGYASASLGSGFLYGPDLHTTKPMRWRAAEIRFGPDIDIFGLVSSGRIAPSAAPRLDIIYLNEGHPDNNHRDGYALQLVLRKNIAPHLNAEFAIGPYFSMNRTTAPNGVESDDARLGGLFSMALLVSLDQYSRGLNLRLGFNHVLMPGRPSSDMLLVGIGKELDGARSSAPDQPGPSPVWLALSGGFAETNHARTEKRFSYAFDVKKYDGRWATSFSGIDEGDDGVRVDRRGVAMQQWYVQPLDKHWAMSAGVGPYLAVNHRESDNWKFNGLMSLEVDRNLGNTLKAFVNFGRVVTFRNKNDADIFVIGLMKGF